MSRWISFLSFVLCLLIFYIYVYICVRFWPFLSHVLYAQWPNSSVEQTQKQNNRYTNHYSTDQLDVLPVVLCSARIVHTQKTVFLFVLNQKTSSSSTKYTNMAKSYGKGKSKYYVCRVSLDLCISLFWNRMGFREGKYSNCIGVLRWTWNKYLPIWLLNKQTKCSGRGIGGAASVAISSGARVRAMPCQSELPAL